MAHNYILRVTAGPEYDLKTHQVVPINAAETIKIDSDLCTVELNVRIQVHPPSSFPIFSSPSNPASKQAKN
jgi:hypothetical protein